MDYLVVMNGIFVNLNIVSQRDILIKFISSFFHGSEDPVGLGLLNEVPQTHSDTQHSVGFL